MNVMSDHRASRSGMERRNEKMESGSRKISEGAECAAVGVDGVQHDGGLREEE